MGQMSSGGTAGAPCCREAEVEDASSVDEHSFYDATSTSQLEGCGHSHTESTPVKEEGVDYSEADPL